MLSRYLDARSWCIRHRSRTPADIARMADWRRLRRQQWTAIEDHTMAEATLKPKAKPVAAPFADVPKFELPKFEIPKFEMPKMEVPAAFREFAEKGVSQAKDNWEK